MKLKYPAEAFALGIVLFSRNMEEAFAAGILVILAVVIAEFLKNLLEGAVPVWSLRLCVLIGTGAIAAGAFLLGFSALGITVDTGTWIMTAVIGLLAGKAALLGELEGDYGSIFYESGILWGFWILLGIAREFLSQGDLRQSSFGKCAFLFPEFSEHGFRFPGCRPGFGLYQRDLKEEILRNPEPAFGGSGSDLFQTF